MDANVLFRKKSPMSDAADNMPWLDCGMSYTVRAKRNPTPTARPSAILVRALKAALTGMVVDIAHKDNQFVLVQVKSTSEKGRVHPTWAETSGSNILHYMPHGGGDRVTYHFGLLHIAMALLAGPTAAADFWLAYEDLQGAFVRGGRELKEDMRQRLVLAADELYYWCMLAKGPDTANRFPSFVLMDSMAVTAPVHSGLSLLDEEILTSPARLADWMRGAGAPPPIEPEAPPTTETTPTRSPWKAVPAVEVKTEEIKRIIESTEWAKTLVDPEIPGKIKAPKPKPAPAPAPPPREFIGWQADELLTALRQGYNALLTGPQGTGKTRCVNMTAKMAGASVVLIEGKDGLTDLDIIGGYVKNATGLAWKDGPLVRAMKMAAAGKLVLLFIDEINRIRSEYLNLLMGAMNPKSGDDLRAMGEPVEGPGPFYSLEIPGESVTVWCPVAFLRYVGAGNFGAGFAVYSVDHALRSRFAVCLDFDYLAADDEVKLVVERCGLDLKVASALVWVAQNTRQMRVAKSLQGSIDTRALLAWGNVCRDKKAATLKAIFDAGKITWADLAVGRDELGRMRQDKFQALYDAAKVKALLPEK